MKWQIGVVGATALAVMAVYAGSKEPSAAQYLTKEYCSARLSDLRLYRLGTPGSAPLSERSTATDVKRCAIQDAKYATLAAPLLTAD